MKKLLKKQKFDLLYAPMLYAGDIGVHSLSKDVWYYQWQDLLWNFFESKKDKRFLWKAGPERTNYFDDPIKNRKAENIIYSTKSIEKELHRTKKVFVDFPSTVFKQALKEYIPSICITMRYDKYIIDKYLKEYPIYYCSDKYIALQLLGNFLYDNMVMYSPSPGRSKAQQNDKVLEVVKGVL